MVPWLVVVQSCLFLFNKLVYSNGLPAFMSCRIMLYLVLSWAHIFFSTGLWTFWKFYNLLTLVKLYLHLKSVHVFVGSVTLCLLSKTGKSLSEQDIVAAISLWYLTCKVVRARGCKTYGSISFTLDLNILSSLSTFFVVFVGIK